MSRIEKLDGPMDNIKLDQMSADEWKCVQVYFDGMNWFGLFVK